MVQRFSDQVSFLHRTKQTKNTNYYSFIVKKLIKNSLTKKTYPADCRKIAAVDSNKHDWD